MQMHNEGINGGSSVSITRGIIYQETSNNYCCLAHILHRAACNIVWPSTCLHCTCRRFAIFVSRLTGTNVFPHFLHFARVSFTIIIFSRNNGTKWKNCKSPRRVRRRAIFHSKICADRRDFHARRRLTIGTRGRPL